jgi:hypothetical protein
LRRCIQIDVVHAEGLEGAVNAFGYAVVPCVVELGGDPDLLTWDTGVLDALTDFILVAVGESSVDVAVAGEESVADGVADLVRLALPSSWIC